jgi:predicted RND superfamily exporter protein
MLYAIPITHNHMKNANTVIHKLYMNHRLFKLFLFWVMVIVYGMGKHFLPGLIYHLAAKGATSSNFDTV